MPSPDLPADLIESKPIVDRLEEEIPAFIELLTVVVQLSVGMEWYQDSLCFVISLIFFRLQSGLFLGPGHHTVSVGIKGLGKLLKRSELAYPFGGAFSFTVCVGLGDVERLRIFRLRCRYLHAVHPLVQHYIIYC